MALLLTFFEVHGLPAEPMGGLRGLLQVSGSDLEACVAEQSPQRHCFLTGAKLLASDGRCLRAEEAWGAELQSSAGGAVVISVHPFCARAAMVDQILGRLRLEMYSHTNSTVRSPSRMAVRSRYCL